MALSRERIADELIKLLGLPDPAATIAVMLDRGILKPVIPEIGPAGGQALATLIDYERAARVAPDGLRRLAALSPRDHRLAEAVAARLKLSNKAKKRLGCAARRRPFVLAPGFGLPRRHRLRGRSPVDRRQAKRSGASPRLAVAGCRSAAAP